MNQKKETFALTLKWNNIVDPKDIDYERVMLSWGTLYDIEYKDVVYEKDSKGKVHMHGVIILPFGFYRKRLKVQGLHVCIRPLTDPIGWNKYCNKCVK